MVNNNVDEQINYKHDDTLLSAVLFVLVRDEEVLARRFLVLVPNKVGNGFILGLFGGGFIALVALAEKLFLDIIDS